MLLKKMYYYTYKYNYKIFLKYLLNNSCQIAEF